MQRHRCGLREENDCRWPPSLLLTFFLVLYFFFFSCSDSFFPLFLSFSLSLLFSICVSSKQTQYVAVSSSCQTQSVCVPSRKQKRSQSLFSSFEAPTRLEEHEEKRERASKRKRITASQIDPERSSFLLRKFFSVVLLQFLVIIHL